MVLRKIEANPYMHEVKQSDLQSRVNHAIEDFVGQRSCGRTLDIGKRNPLTGILEKMFSVEIDSTTIDLDVGFLTGKYDTVFFFEVLEHLFNPLHCLLEIQRVLSSHGRVFISTPRGKPHFLWYEKHFHEMHERELINLIHRAGFEIVKMKYYRILPIWKVNGLRPFLRLLLSRKCILELRLK